MRLKILRLIIACLFVIIAGNLFFVQVIRGQRFYNLSVSNCIRIIPLKERRGRILDRSGVVLADNRLSYDVIVIPQDIKNKKRLFTYLGGILKTDAASLLRRFAQKKITPFAPVVIAQDVEKRTAMILEENKFLFPGLYIQETFNRYYPHGDVGAHLLGHVGKISREKIEQIEEYGYTPQSMVGYSGIEAYYDNYLRGKPGGIQIEVDSRGRQIRLLSLREPESGEDVQLTIDERIQEAAAGALRDRRGAILMMNLDSGEILGMVSSPAYDPNIFTSTRLKKNVGTLYTDKTAPLLNRAIQGLYPPGSVIKPILALAGLDTGQITRNTAFNCIGYLRLGSRRFHCSHVHGRQNLIQGLLHSCNVYFFNVGDQLGPDIIHQYARMFGLGTLTQIDLPFEEQGFVPSRLRRKMEHRGWYRGDTLNFSIGQGDVLVTPLQLLRMMAAVARQGKDIQPHLIKDIGSKNIVKLASVRNIGIPRKYYRIVQEGLRQAVDDPTGTARVLDMPGFRVSGKTGTAQSTPGKEEHAWFVGWDTSGKSKIAFCVFLEYGGSSYHACQVAGQLLRELRQKEIL